MATIAEFSIPADDFPLGHIFETLPKVTIDLERVVPTNHAILPYFWVRNVPVTRVRETLEENGAFESFTVIDDLGDQGLFRADWNADIEGVLTGILDAELTLLSAIGTQDEWVFEFRAEDTDQIAAFRRYCNDFDIDLELSRLHALGEQSGRGRYSLTHEQREALLLAFDDGYYETPPQTNLKGLAVELGIARQSFTDRLRRGTNNLIGETLSNRS